MVNIEIQFTAGRWHATPWGRQVNEGVTEWPPSSWRIMRALVAAWHDKFPDVPRAEMAELVERLNEPPVFQLPNAVPAHLRHYMKLGDGKPTKILDGFLAVCRDEPLRIVWPDVELSERQALLLARLVEVLSYFGRAESWVEARVAENWNGEFNSAPTLAEPASEQGDEVVRVLVPAALEEFDRWREETRESMRRRALEAAAKKKPGQAAPKLGKKQLAEIDAAVPNDLLAALEASTEDLRGGGWNRPPGSRWIDYRRNTDLAPHVARRSRIVRTTTRPTVARFAVSGVVRPMLTEAVAVGELVRIALMSRSKILTGNARSVFSGRDDSGRRADDAHRHAHFYSEAIGDHRITHLLAFAPDGFERIDQRALADLRQVFDRDRFDFEVALLGFGEPSDFGGWDASRGRSPALARSRVWRSRTPVVLTRHLKIRRSERRDPEVLRAAFGRELTAYVRWELRQRDEWKRWADVVEVEPLIARGENGTTLAGRFTTWPNFRRLRRRGDGRLADTTGYGFRLTFPESVSGPLSIGYAAHFGLGLFEAENFGE